ncbi:MAG: SpoIIE family protein phosphatase [bacterium]
MNCPQCHSLQTSQLTTCQSCHYVLRHPRLRVVHQNGPDQIVTLPLREFTIGRHAENDLVLALEGVSRRHSRLCFEEGRYRIEDCGSKNGLFINGQKSDNRILQDQDCLQIGPVRLFFFLTESTATKTEPPPDSSSTGHRNNDAKAAANVEVVQQDQERWREFLMEHFLQGARLLSQAGVASLWLPTIAGELTMHRQKNAATDAFAPLSHEPWQQLAETIFQSPGILMRERATSTNLNRENLLAIAGRSYRILGIPLRASDRPGAPAGVLILENPRGNGCLTRLEAQRLQKLVEQSVIYLAQISRDENYQNSRTPQAASVETTNVAARDVSLPAYDIAYVFRPTSAAGATYLDVITPSETELLFALADVTVKDVAAMKMRDRLQTCLRMHLLYESRPEALAQRLNELVFITSANTPFTGLFLGVLNLQRGILKYVNAGHNPGVMISLPNATPQVELLRSNGAALGTLEKNVVSAQEITIPAGAILIFYTDGVTEATGADGKQYGLTRLLERATAAVLSGENPRATRLVKLLLEDVPAAAAPAGEQSLLVMIERGKVKKS